MDRLTQLEDSRRRFLIQLLRIGAFGAGTSLPTGCTQTSSVIVSELPRGRSIYQLSGRVRVNGKLATRETIIEPGDSIVTDEKSYIIFVLAGEAFILRSHSSMLLRSAKTGSPAAINLSSGKLLSVFTPGKPMLITTPSAVVSIRGTGVYVESGETQSYVCTCYGMTGLAVSSSPSTKETISSNHHDAPRYIIDDGKQQRIEPAPFKNHDDEELLLIETLVGRSTPFTVRRGATRSTRGYF